MTLEYQSQQHIQPVGCDTGAETADGVCTDGLTDELAIAERVEHGGMGAEESAPAHADGGEHGDGVVVDDALLDEAWHQADGSTDSTEGGHREGDEGSILETEQPLEDDVDLVG